MTGPRYAIAVAGVAVLSFVAVVAAVSSWLIVGPYVGNVLVALTVAPFAAATLRAPR